MAFIIRKAGGAGAQERVEAVGIDWDTVVEALESQDNVVLVDESSTKTIKMPETARLIEGTNGYQSLNFEIGSNAFSVKKMAGEFPKPGDKLTLTLTVSVWDDGKAAAITYETWVGDRVSKYEKAGTEVSVSSLKAAAQEAATKESTIVKKNKSKTRV